MDQGENLRGPAIPVHPDGLLGLLHRGRRLRPWRLGGDSGKLWSCRNQLSLLGCSTLCASLPSQGNLPFDLLLLSIEVVGEQLLGLLSHGLHFPHLTLQGREHVLGASHQHVLIRPAEVLALGL